MTNAPEPPAPNTTQKIDYNLGACEPQNTKSINNTQIQKEKKKRSKKRNANER
jgi:hypothetical protein